jgi:hypothetical protein
MILSGVEAAIEEAGDEISSCASFSDGTGVLLGGWSVTTASRAGGESWLVCGGVGGVPSDGGGEAAPLIGDG